MSSEERDIATAQQPGTDCLYAAERQALAWNDEKADHNGPSDPHVAGCVYCLPRYETLRIELRPNVAKFLAQECQRVTTTIVREPLPDKCSWKGEATQECVTYFVPLQMGGAGTIVFRAELRLFNFRPQSCTWRVVLTLGLPKEPGNEGDYLHLEAMVGRNCLLEFHTDDPVEAIGCHGTFRWNASRTCCVLESPGIPWDRNDPIRSIVLKPLSQ